MMRLWLLLVLLLSGCSAGVLPLQKPAPEPVTEHSLVRPPWQALVRAGPDAAKDVDYETLDGPKAAPPAVAPVPSPPPSIEQPAAATTPASAQAKPVDPHATVIKAVAVSSVLGAPGQGNTQLSVAMAKVLKASGWPVLAAPRKDALLISAKVVLDAPEGANQMVHIIWIVTSPKGRVLGTVAQNNPVPAHSLDATWGPNADAAAEAAAEGIFKLIGQYR